MFSISRKNFLRYITSWSQKTSSLENPLEIWKIFKKNVRFVFQPLWYSKGITYKYSIKLQGRKIQQKLQWKQITSKRSRNQWCSYKNKEENWSLSPHDTPLSFFFFFFFFKSITKEIRSLHNRILYWSFVWQLHMCDNANLTGLLNYF